MITFIYYIFSACGGSRLRKLYKQYQTVLLVWILGFKKKTCTAYIITRCVVL